MKDIFNLMQGAYSENIVIPGFNIPYIPMMEPVVQALADTNSFGLIMVARLEWMKFESGSPKAIYTEYQHMKNERHTRLHLDHVPVIDEDNLRVDYASVISEAMALGYDSVMLDGSRLDLEANIKATRGIVKLAHAAGVPVEAELGAVMGHESAPLLSYEEIFASGQGFTDIEEAGHFVKETKVDWLSVAIGNVHGAIAASRKHEKKIEARLNIEHLARIKDVTGVPLVLHGGSGIPKEYITRAIAKGITKINVGTAIRQPYEANKDISIKAAQKAVYDTMIDIIRNELEIENSARFFTS